MNMNMNLNNNIQNYQHQHNLCNQMNNLNLNNNNNNSNNNNEINYRINEVDLQYEENLSKVTENIVSTMEGTINIYNQIKNNCICAIPFRNNNNLEIYTGFFCNIPYKGKKIKVLITSSGVINQYYNFNELIIFFDNFKTQKTIKINKNKIFYIGFNLTIIEIKPEDNLNKNNFLELDENLLINNSKIIYENKSLYILYYQKEKGALISYGSLNKKVSHYLINLCKVEESSAGAPILNLENNKVIGLHFSSKKVHITIWELFLNMQSMI